MAATSLASRSTTPPRAVTWDAMSASVPPPSWLRVKRAFDVGDVGHRLQLAGQIGWVDEDRWLGIAEEEADLVGRVGGVERDVDEAGPQAGEVQGHRIDRLVDLDDDSIPGLGTPVGQHGGHGRTASIDLPVGVGLAAGERQERIVPVVPELGREELIDVVTQRWCTTLLFPGAQLPPLIQRSARPSRHPGSAGPAGGVFQPVARVRRSSGSAAARALSARVRTRPAAPGVSESIRLPITPSVIWAMASVPTASLSPLRRIHG